MKWSPRNDPYAVMLSGETDEQWKVRAIAQLRELRNQLHKRNDEKKVQRTRRDVVLFKIKL